MDSRLRYLLVGMFVLILSGVLIAGILWFSIGSFFQRYDRYLVYMHESVAGLSVDSPVTFLGVDVGSVERLSVEPNAPGQILLLLKLHAGTPIRTDTRAILRTQGLTGLVTIDLVGTTAEAPPLVAPPGHRFPVIKSKPSLMAHLEENISSLLVELRKTVASANTLLNGPSQQHIVNTLASLDRFTSVLAEHADELGGGMTNLAVTLRNARAASARLPGLATRLQQVADTLDTMATQFTASSTDLHRFTRDTLPETSAMVDELYQAARNLREVSQKLQQNPSVLLFGSRGTHKGPGE